MHETHECPILTSEQHILPKGVEFEGKWKAALMAWDAEKTVRCISTRSNKLTIKKKKDSVRIQMPEATT